MQLQQKIVMLEQMVRSKLASEAWARYCTLKLAHPETTMQLLVTLAEAVQAGHVREQITDTELKSLLREMQPKKKQFTIRK